jgi:tagatose-1,6-bisphosphate aldolase non-catalytic subunit AgaZ/GatZ
MVLEACVEQAKEQDSILLIESTSNQVDQFGGYTGMTPASFHAVVQQLADAHGLPIDRAILGGDHLGPNRWRGLGEDEAMANAAGLVRSCVQAGYEKLHLDASMRLAGDPGIDSEPMVEEVVAERTAMLARAAEEAAKENGGSPPVYVIGTEVPVPGGARLPEERIVPTKAKDPAHWKPYSVGGEEEQRLSRIFGYHDRSRYYWALPHLRDRLEMLFANLSAWPVPLTLLSQYLPRQYEAIREGVLARKHRDWVWHRIQETVEVYARACQ